MTTTAASSLLKMLDELNDKKHSKVWNDSRNRAAKVGDCEQAGNDASELGSETKDSDKGLSSDRNQYHSTRR